MSYFVAPAEAKTDGGKWYREVYLQSPWWKRTAVWATRLFGGVCSAPGCKSTWVDVHHKHYDTIGWEMPWDLKLLCRPCHGKEHVAGEGKQYERAVETYAWKMHGSDWRYRIDWDDMAAEFDEWLESKESD